MDYKYTPPDGLLYRAADYLAHVGFATLALLVIFHPF
nr:MAG TPA: hypothetical protein [Caudoviricetes sp.]